MIISSRGKFKQYILYNSIDTPSSFVARFGHIFICVYSKTNEFRTATTAAAIAAFY